MSKRLTSFAARVSAQNTLLRPASAHFFLAQRVRWRRAATHWAYADLLPLVGALHKRSRVVCDYNVPDRRPVRSGIDFAFRIVAELAGPEVASDPAWHRVRPFPPPATPTRRLMRQRQRRSWSIAMKAYAGIQCKTPLFWSNLSGLCSDVIAREEVRKFSPPHH